MKSKKMIFATALIGGLLIGFLQILKPSAFAVFSLFLSAWLYAFWSEGKKTDVKYSYFLLPTFYFAIGNLITVLASCNLLLSEQANTNSPLTLCRSLGITSYVVPTVLFFLGLIGMRYDENRDNYGYNKMMIIVVFVILLLFYVLSLSQELIVLVTM